ncbi:transcriptional regulator [Actinomadura macrotermitis]|uniref:Uncharacterized protein n=1 Tax=Actinomadura macrotermitis TaxID=2585200 RepID=A0A7K0C7S5_9ACTN|nr:transcriptional regulator [Actinomadura macrotermitis]MQY08834.1 hypothetical protein [Actinomadura macrotermitis]
MSGKALAVTAADPGNEETRILAELRRLEKERRTGVLRVGDEGAFHVAEGAVVFAGSRRATGLDRLAVGSGMVSTEEWGRIRLGGLDGAPGLPRPQLEMFALLALFDAAYFLLGSAAVPRFGAGPAHWLAPLCRVTPATLAHECARRRDRLDAVWPVPPTDLAPVVPVRRIRRQRVVLTGLQAELLLNADGRRTPAELALDLGRTTYGCLLAARELGAAGLIRPAAVRAPRAAPPAPVRPPAPAAQWSPPDMDVLVRLRTALKECM